MSLEARLQALAQAIGADVRALLQAPGGGVAQAAFDALLDEVAEARGSRSTLGRRLNAISNFASPNVGGYIVGQIYDAAMHATNSTTSASAANRLELHPFYTSVPLRIDQLGVAVSTASAGAARCVIYSSTEEGWPDELLLSVDQLDTGTAGWRGADVDFTFDSGRQYWLGHHTAAAPTLRAYPTSSAGNLGPNAGTGNGTNYFTVLRQTVTYASGAPASWGVVASNQLASAVNPTSVRFRVAEVLAPVPSVGGIGQRIGTKGAQVFAPVTGERVVLLRAPAALTLQSVAAVVPGATGSVQINIGWGTDASAAGTSALAAPQAINSATSGQVISAFAASAIPSGAWVWLDVGTVTGAVPALALSLEL